MLGLVVAAQAPHPAKWMAAHVSGLLTGLLMIALGGVWPELRLAATTRRRAMQLGLTAAWTGFVANAYVATVNLPGPATDPGRAARDVGRQVVQAGLHRMAEEPKIPT